MCASVVNMVNNFEIEKQNAFRFFGENTGECPFIGRTCPLVTEILLQHHYREVTWIPGHLLHTTTIHHENLKLPWK